MAHWIIEDKGFGGTVYMCSECRHSWNDIYSDISDKEHCPICKSTMDRDQDEYIEDKPSDFARKYLMRPVRDAHKSLAVFQEQESKLIQLSGCDMDKLIELFAAGYTLQPPNKSFDILY